MNQFRYDIINDTQVCIAASRGDRPHTFQKSAAPFSEKEYESDCPFCPGNEKMIPPVIQERSADQSFVTRVIPNKYPIVKSDNKFEKNEQKNFKQMSGFGQHEVLIETPFHNRQLSSMSANEIEAVIDMYLQRYRIISTEKDIKSLFLFKNHGSKAGTSLQHPHSQLVGLPFIPINKQKQEEHFQEHFRRHNQCLICEYLDKEVSEKKRIIIETNDFVDLVPFAAGYPYQQMIIPRKHSADILSMNAGQLSDLADCLRLALKTFDRVNPNAPYNLLFNTISLPVDSTSKYFHWYLNIIPRVNTPAGFEFGSGVNVNSSIPEQDAEQLRAQINN